MLYPVVTLYRTHHIIQLKELLTDSLKMGHSHSPSAFQRIFEEATTLATALVMSITSQPDYWLQHLTALQQAYNTLTAANNILTKRMNALEGVDRELAKACVSVTATQEALNHSLTEQLRLMQQQNSLSVTSSQTSRPSPNHPDPEKFNGDKMKLEAFITQLRICYEWYVACLLTKFISMLNARYVAHMASEC